jgi:hypothetical protein
LVVLFRGIVFGFLEARLQVLELGAYFVEIGLQLFHVILGGGGLRQGRASQAQRRSEGGGQEDSVHAKLLSVRECRTFAIRKLIKMR